MGKRSDFPRIHKNKYLTWDPRAVPPLLAHLRRGFRYKEPCAGAGDLIRQLEPFAHCVEARDIEPQADFIAPGDMMQVEIGDFALFFRKAAIEIAFEEENYLVVPHSAILILVRGHDIPDQLPEEL